MKQLICPVCGRGYEAKAAETLCYQCQEAASSGENMLERKKHYDDVRQQYLSHAEHFGLEDDSKQPEKKPFWKFWK